MGLLNLFGGDKKTENKTTTNNETNYTDNRTAVSEGFLVSGGGSVDMSDRSRTNTQTTIITTDGGAIEGAFGVAKAYGQTGEVMLQASLNAVDSSVERAFGAVNRVVDSGFSLAESSTSRALDFGERALDSASSAFDKALARTEAAAASEREFADDVLARVSADSKSTDTQNTQLIIKAVVGVAIAGFVFLAIRSAK